MRLVATERHVEAALGTSIEGDARTVRGFLRDLVAPHSAKRAPATPEITLLATAAAIDALPTATRRTAPVLASTFDAALGELRRAGVDGATLGEGGERGRVLAHLLEATDAHLARAGLFDDRGIGWVAADAIAATPRDALPAETIIEGLESFTNSDLAWIEALAERSRLVVRLPSFSAGAGAAREAGGAGAALARIASDASHAVLSPLESRWQAMARAPDIEPVLLPLPEAVDLVEARSDLVEARAAVRSVLAALDRGAEPERIAIVVPDLDEAFLEPLRSALDEAKIPFSEPRGRPPTACPLAAAALAWIRIAIGPVTRDDLVDLVQNREISPEFFLGPPATAGDARRTPRAALGDLARALSQLAVGADGDGSLLVASLAEACGGNPVTDWMPARIESTLARLGRLRQADTRRRVIDELCDAWDAMGLGRPSAREIGEAVVLGDQRRHRALRTLHDRAVAIRVLATALDRLGAAAGVLGLADAPVDLPRVRSELEHAVRGASGGAGALHSAAVHIARAREVAGLPHDLVIITRASEATFDSSTASSSLLDESVLSAVAANRRPPSRHLARAVARCEVLSALSLARTVVVSRTTADADGRPLAPATFFAALGRAGAPRIEPASRLYPHAVALSRHEARLARVGRALDDDSDVRLRVEGEQERARFFLEPKAAPLARSGQIGADVAATAHWAALIGGTTAERPFSTTTLERAAGCRFAAFAIRVLGAGRADDVGEDLDPRTRGSLVHRALKIALEALRETPASSSVQDAQASALAAVERVLLSGSPLRRAEIAGAMSAVLRVVRWSKEEDPGFSLWFAEQPFGVPVPDAWPPLEIDIDGRRAYLSGRIDRLDRSSDGRAARIIDYKTGAIPGPRDEPRLFQLPLYGRALTQARPGGELEEALELKGLYLGASSGAVQATPSKRQALSEQDIAAKERDAATIIAKLWRGDVAPRPLGDDVCSHCDARDVCRRPVVMPIEPGDDEAAT